MIAIVENLENTHKQNCLPHLAKAHVPYNSPIENMQLHGGFYYTQSCTTITVVHFTTFASLQKGNPAPFNGHPPFTFPAPGKHACIFCLSGSAYSGHFLWIESHSTWPFCAWVVSLSIMHLRFIHIVVCVRTSFLFKNFIVLRPHNSSSCV